MKPQRDEEGRIVRDGYSTRDGYQDDPGKPEPVDDVIVIDGIEYRPLPAGYVSPGQRREAFDGLLRFVEQHGGSMEITTGRWNDGRTWWQVAVLWYSIANGNRKVYAEDASFDEACLMCRGLLAHSLASGVATP